MSDEWFWCKPCDIEFQDPYAPEEDGTVYGECPLCGRTIERPTKEEFERKRSGGEA